MGKITGLGGIGDAAGGGTADGGHIIGQLVQLPQNQGGVPVENVPASVSTSRRPCRRNSCTPSSS